MTVATTARALFLGSPERSAIAADATLTARWGTAAGDTSQSTALVEEGAASAEAARQLALLGAALAEDQVVVEGLLWDIEGEAVTLDYTAIAGGPLLGGGANVTMLVISARVSLAEGTTLLRGFIRL